MHFKIVYGIMKILDVQLYFTNSSSMNFKTPRKQVRKYQPIFIKFLGLVIFIGSLISCQHPKALVYNPILPGYYADPTIVLDQDTYYIYATKDPWGGEDLAVFETKDFKSFKEHTLNWPTKSACTSSTSGSANVWAPSVTKGVDGKFYMYVSVGNEVWAGVSDQPLGPWRNLKEDDTPLIKKDLFPEYHMIDAEIFIDDDEQAYLYWGSGWDWKNGACFVVKLQPDMHTFMGAPVNVTPPDYFEGPYMLKKEGLYYLMYSNGKAIDSTYNIQYAVGKTPLGPWIKGGNNPILQTQGDTIIGPGHHTVFQKENQYYILYHKIFPQKKDYVLRQLCLDSLNFDDDNHIEKVIPQGVRF